MAGGGLPIPVETADRHLFQRDSTFPNTSGFLYRGMISLTLHESRCIYGMTPTPASGNQPPICGTGVVDRDTRTAQYSSKTR